MPEAAVHLNRSLMTGQHDVWCAWQVAPMQAKAEAHCVEHLTRRDLGACVLLGDGAHDLGALWVDRSCGRRGLWFH